jgi:molybdate transport system substrate-binding protein
MRSPYTLAATLILCVASLGLAGTAAAADVKVMNSGGFSAAYKALAPSFEKSSHDRLDIAWGPSMGTTHDAIPVRLARGEPADVLIMVGYALDDLAKKGKVVSGSAVELARSPIGIAVRKGAPKPDISSVDALRRTLLAAKSVVYSDSASGVYVGNELFKRLGIADQMKAKSKMIPATPVAEIVARGDAEIGFQQISEMLPVKGAEVVGPLPAEVQKYTVFSAGLASGAASPDEGRRLIKFLASPAAYAAIKHSGLEPIAHASQ